MRTWLAIIGLSAAIVAGPAYKIATPHITPSCSYESFPKREHSPKPQESKFNIDKTRDDNETRVIHYPGFDVFEVNKIPYAYWMHRKSFFNPAYGCLDRGDGQFSQKITSWNQLQIPRAYY